MTTLLLSLALAQAPDDVVTPTDPAPAEVGPPDPTRHARALGRIPVRASPDAAAARIGQLDTGSVFAWVAPAEGAGCTSGWAALAGGGYACLTDTEPTADPTTPLPRLVRFDPPEPTEWDRYLATGTWDRDVDTEEALLPFVYGKRWRDWKGSLYADLDAWERGDPPVGRLAGGGGVRNHFTDVVESPRGAVLVRVDGRVVPIAETHVYPIDRFEGRELEASPVEAGWLPAWVVAYSGAPLRDAPGGAEGAVLPYHTPLDARAAGVGWWEVRDGVGATGFLSGRTDLRVWVPADPPAEVGPDELWVDVVLDQQVLALRRGPEVSFVTLVTTGLSGATPTGVYRVTDKTIHADMDSSPRSADAYHVEEVPWVMHFKPRYALHGTFWHWAFGHRASHGCINLAPRDARTVFEQVHPVLPDGWHDVVARPEDPGTVVRIR